MEPRIQFAKTKDGVSIAFWTMGDGEPPLVVLPTVPFSHIEREWRLPSYRHWYESLAARRMLIRYDSRGHGLSDDINADYSLDSYVMDLEAVVDRLDLKQVALFGAYQAGQPAIGYAARNPNRVSHLLLWCSYAQGTDPLQTAQIRATRRLVEEDWRTWLETVTHIMFGWSAGDERRQTAQAFSEMTDPETLQAFWEANTKIDVTPLLPSVKAPTLVLHRREFRMVDVGVARKMASTIPAARLVLLEGGELAPFAGHTEAAQQAIDEFLGGDEEGAVIAELPEGMAVILFADIVDSTALTEQLGDAAFREKAAELDALLRKAIRESNGMAVEGKLVGDGLMAVFTSARQAVEAALKCGTAGNSVGLQLHLGIHAGDVIREGNNVYGGAVNIAARIATASAPGEVLVSDTVRGLARTSAGVAFDDKGEHSLKGIEEPQRLFAVKGGG